MAGPVYSKSSLETYLNQFELGFLAKNKDFLSIPNIGKLVSDGEFSKAILYELQVKAIGGTSENVIGRMAFLAFSKMQSITDTFLKSNALAPTQGTAFVETGNSLNSMVAAFKIAMEIHKVKYTANDSPLDCMLRSYIDCDTSAQLFIQLARKVDKSVNLELLQVYYENTATFGGNHQLVLANKNQVVETTLLLYDGEDGAQASANSSPNRKGVGTITSKDFEKKAADAKYLIYPLSTSYTPLPFKSDPKKVTEKGENHIAGIASLTIADYKKLEVYMKKYPFTDQPSFKDFKFHDRKEYAEYEAHFRSDWETQKKAYEKGECSSEHAMKAFEVYNDFLNRGAGLAWIAGVDNEKDIMRLYKTGEKIFGKDALDKRGIGDMHTFRKILNPVDYFMAKRDS